MIAVPLMFVPVVAASKLARDTIVNYLKRFSPVLTELSEPLRRLQK